MPPRISVSALVYETADGAARFQGQLNDEFVVQAAHVQMRYHSARSKLDAVAGRVSGAAVGPLMERVTKPLIRRLARAARLLDGALLAALDAIDAAVMAKQSFASPRTLPLARVRLLTRWMFDHLEHPYPTPADRTALLDATGVSRSVLASQLANRRHRLRSRSRTWRATLASGSTPPGFAALVLANEAELFGGLEWHLARTAPRKHGLARKN